MPTNAFLRKGQCWRSVFSLRHILEELDYDHDRRADRRNHRADKREFFKQAHKGLPDSDGSLLTRKAPACHTHRASPFGPQQRRPILKREARPDYLPVRVFSHLGEGTLAGSWRLAARSENASFLPRLHPAIHHSAPTEQVYFS